MIYVIGIVGGFVTGFFGAGGGLVILPAVINIIKLNEYKARGTVLASVLVATLITSIFYAKYNYFDLMLVTQVAIGGTVGGFVGAKIMKKIPKILLSIIFDIFLISASIKMLFGG